MSGKEHRCLTLPLLLRRIGAQILQSQFNNVVDGWRRLLEEQAVHAEAHAERLQSWLQTSAQEREIAQVALQAKTKEWEMLQAALADLLAAASRLKRDSSALVRENKVISSPLLFSLLPFASLPLRLSSERERGNRIGKTRN